MAGTESHRVAWQVGPAGLSADLRSLAAQWEEVADILEDPEVRSLRRENVSAWSCGDQAHHLLLTGGWIARQLIERTATQKPDDGSSEGSTSPAALHLLESGVIPRGAAQSPAPMVPEAKDPEFWTGLLQRVRQDWQSIQEKALDLETNSVRFPHPALGSLNATEWVRFCAVHGAHHLSIVEDIRKPHP